MALKLVVMKLVCVKLVMNFWRSAPKEKTDCKKRPVYAVGGYTRLLTKKGEFTEWGPYPRDPGRSPESVVEIRGEPSLRKTGDWEQNGSATEQIWPGGRHVRG